MTLHIKVKIYYNRPKYYIFGDLVFVPFKTAYINNIGDELSTCALLCTPKIEANEFETGELVMLSRVCYFFYLKSVLNGFFLLTLCIVNLKITSVFFDVGIKT